MSTIETQKDTEAVEQDLKQNEEPSTSQGQDEKSQFHPALLQIPKEDLEELYDMAIQDLEKEDACSVSLVPATYAPMSILLEGLPTIQDLLIRFAESTLKEPKHYGYFSQNELFEKYFRDSGLYMNEFDIRAFLSHKEHEDTHPMFPFEGHKCRHGCYFFAPYGKKGSIDVQSQTCLICLSTYKDGAVDINAEWPTTREPHNDGPLISHGSRLVALYRSDHFAREGMDRKVMKAALNYVLEYLDVVKTVLALLGDCGMIDESWYDIEYKCMSFLREIKPEHIFCQNYLWPLNK